MTTISKSRLATLKRNGGMARFIPFEKAAEHGAENCRPQPGPRMDRKWTTTSRGDCVIFYQPETDRWVMRVSGRKIKHDIAGDSDPARINAHWKSFCKANNA